jgi:hypothetical protein
MPFLRYSQRLLNPFRGVVNCIRYRSAEAVTADGVRWDIYVSNEALREDMPDRRHTQVSDIRYGSWSEKSGLKRGPIFPSEDFRLMEAMGTRVYEHLLEVHQDVPFPFLDSAELWLLDSRDQPLALLESALDPDDIETIQLPRWNPGLACRRTFTSAAAESLPVTDTGPGAISDYLAAYINSARTAKVPAAQVFLRSACGDGGTGLRGINIDEALKGRTLGEQAFPAMLLDLHHHDSIHEKLVRDFVSWQAPWQLLLPSLGADARQTFEQDARVQPLKVEQQHRLYPEIIDRGVIDSARVEARLRMTLPKDKTREDIMTTFYIELGPEFTDEV